MNNDYKISNFDYTDFLNIPLDTEEQNIFAELLDCRNENNRLIQFRGLIPLLDSYYIKTVNKTIRINGKQKRIVYLSDEFNNIIS